MNDAREQAEKAAVRVGAELSATLAELGRRRRRALDVKHQVDKHFALLVALAAGVAVAAGVTVVLTLARSRARRGDLFAERMRGLRRAWENPHRIARSASAPVISAETARRIGAALAVMLAAGIAKRSAQRLLPSDAPR